MMGTESNSLQKFDFTANVTWKRENTIQRHAFGESRGQLLIVDNDNGTDTHFSGDDTRYRLNGKTISVKMLVTYRTDGQAHYSVKGWCAYK